MRVDSVCFLVEGIAMPLTLGDSAIVADSRSIGEADSRWCLGQELASLAKGKMNKAWRQAVNKEGCCLVFAEVPQMGKANIVMNSPGKIAEDKDELVLQDLAELKDDVDEGQEHTQGSTSDVCNLSQEINMLMLPILSSNADFGGNLTNASSAGYQSKGVHKMAVHKGLMKTLWMQVNGPVPEEVFVGQDQKFVMCVKAPEGVSFPGMQKEKGCRLVLAGRGPGQIIKERAVLLFAKCAKIEQKELNIAEWEDIEKIQAAYSRIADYHCAVRPRFFLAMECREVFRVLAIWWEQKLLAIFAVVADPESTRCWCAQIAVLLLCRGIPINQIDWWKEKPKMPVKCGSHMGVMEKAASRAYTLNFLNATGIASAQYADMVRISLVLGIKSIWMLGYRVWTVHKHTSHGSPSIMWLVRILGSNQICGIQVEYTCAASHLMQKKNNSVSAPANCHAKRGIYTLVADGVGRADSSAVMIAALNGTLDVLIYIVKSYALFGGDIDQACGHDGTSTLHCAVGEGSESIVEVAKILCNAGFYSEGRLGRKPGWCGGFRTCLLLLLLFIMEGKPVSDVCSNLCSTEGVCNLPRRGGVILLQPMYTDLKSERGAYVTCGTVNFIEGTAPVVMDASNQALCSMQRNQCWSSSLCDRRSAGLCLVCCCMFLKDLMATMEVTAPASGYHYAQESKVDTNGCGNVWMAMYMRGLATMNAVALGISINICNKQAHKLGLGSVFMLSYCRCRVWTTCVYFWIWQFINYADANLLGSNDAIIASHQCGGFYCLGEVMYLLAECTYVTEQSLLAIMVDGEKLLMQIMDNKISNRWFTPLYYMQSYVADAVEAKLCVFGYACSAATTDYQDNYHVDAVGQSAAKRVTKLLFLQRMLDAKKLIGKRFSDFAIQREGVCTKGGLIFS